MYKMAVVDDDKDWCFVVERFFRKEFKVYTFYRVSSFLQQPADYDIVLVDFYMPTALHEKHIDGCELIRTLKATLTNPPLCIFTSGFISKNDSELGRELCSEADAFVAKDAGLENLSQNINQLLASKAPQLRNSQQEE